MLKVTAALPGSLAQIVSREVVQLPVALAVESAGDSADHSGHTVIDLRRQA